MHAEPTDKETPTMASEKRCDASHYLITGINAGDGPMILECAGYAIRVEVFGGPGPDRPDLRWDAVRLMIGEHTDDPKLEADEDEGVLDLNSRKDRAS